MSRSSAVWTAWERELWRHGFCREGVWELRIDVGAGYRVYYAQAGQTPVLLLCGGDKRSQAAGIDRAVECWQDYERRLP